jgi:HKD family nuclease
METPIIVAIVGISGVVAGAMLQASLQFFFGKRIELSKQFKLLQTQAYVDFIKGWTGSGRAISFGDKEKEIEYTILMSEARVRIAVYGSEKVVKKLSEFIREYNENYSEKGQESFADLVKIMREDNIQKVEIITKDETSMILHGGKPKKKSN